MTPQNKVHAPKVSVVMAVYDAERYLKEATESILNQSFEDFEFLIIEDGSTDRSSTIIHSYRDSRIRLLTQQNQGLPKSLNRGIRAAKGELIARMDGDDVSDPERLGNQVAFLRERPGCHLVGTNACYMTEDGTKLYQTRLPLDSGNIGIALEKLDTPFIHGSVTFRRDAVLTNGLYDESFPFSQDFILWYKLHKAGLNMANLPEVLYQHRLSPGAISSVSPAILIGRRAYIRRYLENGMVPVEGQLKVKCRSPVLLGKQRKAYYHLRVGKIFLEILYDSSNARFHLLKAVSFSPCCLSAWVNLVLCFLPVSWIKVWKNWLLRRWLVWGKG